MPSITSAMSRKKPATSNSKPMNDSSRVEQQERAVGRKTPRCPYCVESSEFRVMDPGDRGDGWYMCDNCGHLAIPGHPDFKCRCAKCVRLSSKTRLSRITRMFRLKSFKE
jgi:hypothetical protein